MIPAPILTSLALALGVQGVLAAGVGLWAWRADLASALGFFLLAAAATFTSGGLLLATRGRAHLWTRRSALVGAAAVWAALALGGLVPFWIAGAAPHAALFDAVSAVTTTGHWSPRGTAADPALLLWRALLQWAGGLVTLVFAAAVFLQAGLGGAHDAMPGPAGEGGMFARAALPMIAAAYAALTAACAVLLGAGGAGTFDSVLYALSAVATGGDPKGYPSVLPGPHAGVVLAVFMLAGALWFPGGLGRVRPSLAALVRDRETLLLAALVAAGTAFAWLAVPGTGLADGFFVAASLVSTSGMVTEAREAAATPLLALAVIGGSVAGVAGGLRLRRVWLLGAIIWDEVNRGAQPHEVRTLRYGGLPTEPGVVPALFAFAVLWFTACAVLAGLLSVTGLSAEDSILGAVAAITNTGPGMATLVGADPGPAGAFGSSVLMAGMLLGRLEVVALVSVLSPSFWVR